jgi:hypothetical protein
MSIIQWHGQWWNKFDSRFIKLYLLVNSWVILMMCVLKSYIFNGLSIFFYEMCLSFQFWQSEIWCCDPLSTYLSIWQWNYMEEMQKIISLEVWKCGSSSFYFHSYVICYNQYEEYLKGNLGTFVNFKMCLRQGCQIKIWKNSQIWC